MSKGQKQRNITFPEHSYLVFMDEVGDVKCHPPKEYHDPSVFPIHTITAVAIPRTVYRDFFVPAMAELKQKYFGTEDIHFHSREIRKRSGPFKILSKPETNMAFHDEMQKIMDASGLVIASSSINKIKLVERVKEFEAKRGVAYTIGDLYLRNFQYAIERIAHYIGPRSAQIVFETRGKGESKRVQSTLEELKSSGNWYHSNDRFSHFAERVMFFTKEDNVPGLEIADYCAHPFAVHCMNGEEYNDTFESIYKYIYKGNYGVYGLKEWP